MVHRLSLLVPLLLLCLANIQHHASAWMASPATSTGAARVLSQATVAGTRPHRHLTSASAPSTPARSVALFSQVAAEADETSTTEKEANSGDRPANTKKGDIESAKTLLKKYGVAYLATSISLSILSMNLCYLAVSSGVDVAALLAKLGIRAGGKKAGTFAIAYAAHKAASPIRFPPTVILSRYAARLMGKKSPKVQEETIAQ